MGDDSPPASYYREVEGDDREVEGDDAALAKTPTGIGGLDEVTYGGLPTGRPTLVLGNAGCGKSLLAMSFLVHGATEFDEPGVFVSFEETPGDLITNVRSLGFDLPRLIDSKVLHLEHVDVDPSTVTVAGDFDLEALFIRIGAAIDRVGARRVVIDTIESLFSGFENASVLRATVSAHTNHRRPGRLAKGAVRAGRPSRAQGSDDSDSPR